MATDFPILYNYAEFEIYNDYSRNKNINDNIKIEEKYSDFLDYLKKLIIKNREKNCLGSKYSYEASLETILPIKYKDILYNKKPCGNLFSYILYEDISKYLENRKIFIFCYFRDKQHEMICYKSDHPEFIAYHLQIDKYDYLIYKNISKIPKLEQEISSLQQTNQDILKKLDEQIQLNSKLCERIFEMKEEKFKDEKILNNPVSNINNEINALHNSIKIIKDMIKNK
jgi:uncharacterized protein (UPF0335 family)